MSTVELQIAERARKFKEEPLTNLSQFITCDMLYREFNQLNKYSSSGTDDQDWFDYSRLADQRLPELLSEYKSGSYKAPSIRRVYIPKGKTEKRPLGIPTIEDKVLQSAVRRVLEPIYEGMFKDFSYGFRPNRSCHKAIEYMFQKVSFGGMPYIIDADIQNYFGSINHRQLRSFLDQRVKDGKVRKMLDKWLKAGILEDDTLSYPEEGTPQGGIVSPLLSNIYLHYVLDEWFSEVIQPLLKGRSFIVRYADDFVLGFEREKDAKRVMEVLFKRFEKYSLRLHPEKTRMVNLNQPERGNRSFDFLGFTHYMGKSRKGNPVLKRKTSKKKYSNALNNMGDWLKRNRHYKIRDIIHDLNVKLRGYYNYYGITFNARRLAGYFNEVKTLLHKWLNRRGGKPSWNWGRFAKLVNQWCPLLKPRIVHSYL
jgi:group II intron reverse transcriptase/maturase